MYKAFLDKHQLMTIGLSLLFGFIGALIAQGVLSINKKGGDIATVNITALFESYVKETAKQDLSLDKKQAQVKRFGKALSQTIDELSTTKKTILLPSEAILAGVQDVTPTVQKMIKKRLQQGAVE